MRSIFVIAICIVFLQLEYVQCYQSRAKLPSMSDTDASQWLAIRSLPRRFRQQYLANQQPDDLSQAFGQLQAMNDNGIRQFDSQSIDGIPMEVLYELSQKGGKYK
ncbi:unnamed protein product [Adineta ricciae]|uniref:Uncharacterized protein n=1 Tax=Adineta ricciae TaxID=249248 RepID=A0A815CU36_ADIRI|nr:unnamed protein product [Adineta ricciae]